jgi:copper resistance protein B
MKIAAISALVAAGVLGATAVAQDPHAAHEHTPPPATPPVGDASPPPAIRDNFADQHFPASAMDRARDILNREHGGGRISKVMANILEFTTGSGDEGYRWNIEGRLGGDFDRFVFKTEGEAPGGEVDSGEVQGLYARAIGRYTDLQTGVRYDFEPNGVAYATVGIETLLPYWFEVEGALFLSEQGDTFARLEGSYDLQLSQRLILEPRVELTLAAQDLPESNVGSGLSLAEIGLRLRYDIRREFSPYIGVNFEKRFGGTADMTRASGDEVDHTSVVFGLRAWF